MEETIQAYVDTLHRNQLFSLFKEQIEQYSINPSLNIISLYEFITSHLHINKSLLVFINYLNIEDFIYQLICKHASVPILNHSMLREQIQKLSIIFKNNYLDETLHFQRHHRCYAPRCFSNSSC